ncbi:hypothetical protein BSKO_05735 [Bryopsis sp. KO-2023]|nr:hypothetical protein BSKO_05735 [Bryopsis sp. KO-2023]
MESPPLINTPCLPTPFLRPPKTPNSARHSRGRFAASGGVSARSSPSGSQNIAGHSKKDWQLDAVQEPSVQVKEAEAPTGDAPQSPFYTGGMSITTAGAASSFAVDTLAVEKQIVIVRHGLSVWNQEGIIQGNSNESELTMFGETQALRCRAAIQRIPFDSCFVSPLKRAYRTGEIIWNGREGPIVPLDQLSEAYLGRLQGMKNDVAGAEYPEEFRAWREKPLSFCIDGHYPVREVFDEAKEAWKIIMKAPGSTHLIVTHKSIFRALLCTALGLSPASFRAIDVHNGSISEFRVNKRGEPMLTGLNWTSHMHTDNVFY